MSSLTFNLIGWPIGILLGLLLAKGITFVGSWITRQPLFSFLGFVLCFSFVFWLAQKVFNAGLIAETYKKRIQSIQRKPAEKKEKKITEKTEEDIKFKKLPKEKEKNAHQKK